MSPSDVTPTQIRIPPGVKRDAKVMAAREGTNLSHVVVRLLREYGEGKHPTPRERGNG